ncbi:MAG: hypothetical protein K2P04_05640 [Oscillospiraceae bacterium]|nr:hypothetical protein [Oscillospiraceae bacterium]MDE6997342.1 hypothetical protein [Oscillospiraceae bacterium]
MTLYEKYKKLGIDFSQLSLEPGDTSGGYFCTPKGAEVIGWAGVDGIHCCFVDGFGGCSSFYSSACPHSVLGWISPAHFETALYTSAA